MLSVYSVLQKITRGSKADNSLLEEAVFLGNAEAQLSRKEVFSTDKGTAFKMTEGVFSTVSFDNLPGDLYFPQNLPSCLVSHVLDVKFIQPQEGEVILDMCAAPGGKTTHIAALAKNSAQVTALERSTHRFNQLKSNHYLENLDMWELDSVQLVKMDATKSVERFGREAFDKILLDAPCTALGQRPCLSPQQVNIEQAAEYQRKLLQTASELLKVGGKLVYSTCTTALQENQENIAWALEHLPLELLPQRIYLGCPSEPKGLTQVFEPSGEFIGFFIALLVKL